MSGFYNGHGTGQIDRVFKAWLEGKVSKRAKDSLSTDGVTIFSYAMAVVTRVDKFKHKTAIINMAKASKTTSHHQSALLSDLTRAGYEIIRVEVDPWNSSEAKLLKAMDEARR